MWCSRAACATLSAGLRPYVRAETTTVRTLIRKQDHLRSYVRVLVVSART